LKIDKKNLVIGILNQRSIRYSDEFIKVHGTPTILAHAILSPLANGGLFQKEETRREFAAALQQYFHQKKF
jgi:hypothetical protein